MDWPSIPASNCSALDSLTGDDRLAFERMAGDFLWNVTGQRFGTDTATIRPRHMDCGCLIDTPSTFAGLGPHTRFSQPPLWRPELIGGKWYNLTCGCTPGMCGCGASVNAVSLPGPVIDVLSVRLDGVLLDASEYALRGSRWLVRLDGSAWPTHQDLDLASTEVGTWEVVYRRGVEVPSGGQVAAGLLACELALAARNDAACRLPQRLKSITRQGVTMAIIDTFEDVEKGFTGIWLIDSWTASVNRAQHRQGHVYSVDVPRRG